MTKGEAMRRRQTSPRERSRVGHAMASAVAVASVLVGLTACSPSPIDVTEDCTDAGTQPAGEPGTAEVLLTASGGYVLYADGWMVVSADQGGGGPAVQAMQVPLMAPPVPAGNLWQPAYLGSCQVAAIDALAAEELTDGEDLGSPMITDSPTTSVTYYGGEEPVRSGAYALGDEAPGDGLSRAQQQGREVLKGLIAALDEATVTGEVLPIETVRITNDVGEPEPPGWPGPPLEELLGDTGCGELTGQQAVAVYEYLSERTHADVGWLRATVVAPGMTACS